MPRALIVGGTSLVGRATARRLLAAGWRVDLTGRDPSHLPADIAAAGGTLVAADRRDSRRLLAALDDGADETLGRHPWDAPHPIVLDLTAAAELGYTPIGDYATTVTDEIAWLVAAARGAAGAATLPGLDDSFFGPLFDYAAEDRYLATHP